MGGHGEVKCGGVSGIIEKRGALVLERIIAHIPRLV